MQMRFSGLIVGLFFGFTAAKGQVGIIPSADTLYGSANEIVVTATRTEKKLGNVAVPVTLISSKQIAQAGSVRLADILQEQAGLFITTGFGAGVQMQGLNPDYTLILLNGEPLASNSVCIPSKVSCNFFFNSSSSIASNSFAVSPNSVLL